MSKESANDTVVLKTAIGKKNIRRAYMDASSSKIRGYRYDSVFVNWARMYAFRVNGHYSTPFYGASDKVALDAWKECVKLYGIVNTGDIYHVGFFDHGTGKLIPCKPFLIKE